MKLYEITMRPISSFGTPLKGDAIFGQFCWQAAYFPDLIEGGLENALARYETDPFAVFSTAFLKLEKKQGTLYVLKRPDLPPPMIFRDGKTNREESYRSRKENKKKKWLVVRKGLEIDLSPENFWDDKKLLHEAIEILTPETKRRMKKSASESPQLKYAQSHNTINRLTGTTGPGMFAPYEMENVSYFPETELVVFVLVDETQTDIERIRAGLENIGKFGFGRDASAGLGKFEVCETDEISVRALGKEDWCYALAPCVPEKDAFSTVFFAPFVRFGKHGDRLVFHKNPFKNPVVMADEGAVLKPRKDAAVFPSRTSGEA